MSFLSGYRTYILAAFTFCAALLNLIDGKISTMDFCVAAAGAIGLVTARKGASNDVAAHIEAAHPPTQPGFGEQVNKKNESGRARSALLAFLFFLCAVIAGCASAIPKEHVQADLAWYMSAGKEWNKYYHTGFAPDGSTLTASAIAIRDGEMAARRKDILESAKTAGMVPSDATNTASIGGE